MAAIDRTKLLADEKLWLPDSNVLSDQLMAAINESVITNQIPADDSIYYSEALCKALRAIALVNKAKFEVDEKGTKKEIVGDVELERFEASSIDPWGDYIDSLQDICPILGYTGLNAGIGILISPGDEFIINDCPYPNSALRDDTGFSI